jgi:hypothetical protein
MFTIEKSIGNHIIGAGATLPRVGPGIPTWRGTYRGGLRTETAFAIVEHNGVLLHANSSPIGGTLQTGAPNPSSNGQYSIPVLSTWDVTTSPTVPPWTGRVRVLNTAFSTLHGIGDITMNGDIAICVGSSNNLLLCFDCSDPTNVRFLGSVQVHPSQTLTNLHTAVRNNYAYVVNPTLSQVRIFDVSNPAAPFFVNAITDTTNMSAASGIGISGSTLFVYGERNPNGGRLSSWSLASPTAPTFLQVVDDAATPAGIGEFPDLYVDGNFAYAIISSQFTVFNITNPSAMTVQGFVASALFTSSFQAWLAIDRLDASHMVVVIGNTGLFAVVNVSNPSAPTITGSTTLGSNIFYRDVATFGNYAYVPASVSHVAIYDCTTRSAPTLIGRLPDDGLLDRTLDIEFNTADGVLWSTSGDGTLNKGRRLTSWNVTSTPTNPQPIQSTPFLTKINQGQKLIIRNNIAWVGDMFQIGTGGNIQAYDISTGTPVFIGAITDPAMGNLTGLMLSGNLAFFCTRSTSGWGIVDIANPAAMFIRALGSVNGAFESVMFADGHLGILGNGIMSYFVVTDPNNPQIIGSTNDGNFNSPRAVAVDGQDFFVLRSSSITKYTKAAGAAAAQFRGTFSNAALLVDGQDVTIKDQFAYIADKDGRLLVLDVSAGTPVLVHTVNRADIGDDYFYPTTVAVRNNTVAMTSYPSADLYVLTV